MENKKAKTVQAKISSCETKAKLAASEKENGPFKQRVLSKGLSKVRAECGQAGKVLGELRAKLSKLDQKEEHQEVDLPDTQRVLCTLHDEVEGKSNLLKNKLQTLQKNEKLER